MLQTVMNDDYWLARLRMARISGMHYAAYDVDEVVWDDIQQAHSEILASLIPHDRETRILDIACNYGSLMECLPPGIQYTGVDYHKCLVDAAARRHPHRKFVRTDDYKELPPGNYDLAVCRSLDGSIKEQLGFAEWRRIENAILDISDSLLLLNYSDPRTYRMSDSVRNPEEFTHNTICFDGGQLVYRVGQDATCEIYDLLVPEEKRRSGIATKLIDELFTVHPGTVYGFTRSTNREAQAFYSAVGFTLQTVPNLYRGEDGVLFSQQRLPGAIE